MSIENNFDIAFVAGQALREKQIQQNYRPIIAVHKWFARRPGTLFRALVLSEFGGKPVAETFFASNSFAHRLIADPFMGGGTPLIEANRVGCDVQGFDINPMAAWIVREEIERLDVQAYRAAAGSLIAALADDLGDAYRTDCPLYGDRDVAVKYFMWVKTLDCANCGEAFDLFPGYLLANDARHPKHVLVCSACGDLNEVVDPARAGKCRGCGAVLVLAGPARRGRCACPRCEHVNSYPRPEVGPLRHRLFAIEYYNPLRKDTHAGRFFKKPDAKDLKRLDAVFQRWKAMSPRFIPHQAILPGDETGRLHRWGYQFYRDLFNDRQLLGLELSCRLITSQPDERLRHALATNFSDLLRYQNMLCRYDTTALKSLDVFSVHGFPVGLVQCESNLLGITNGGGGNVGSGGWNNIVEKYAKAKEYCAAPFETRHTRNRKTTVPVKGEWIGEWSPGEQRRKVALRCVDSATVAIEPDSLDAVFTDPPYFANVQYGELMDFCYVWLRQLVASDAEGFGRASTRSKDELTGNQTEARGLAEFAQGLGAVYRAMARGLKPGAPLAFTFHHNRLDAYEAVGVAILDAGLVCSASLPCPGEMGGSIHIHGTNSSIVDTVFVCRKRQEQAAIGPIDEAPDQLVGQVRRELDQLCAAGMKPSAGDVRCILYGHLTRLAVWRLNPAWDASLPAPERLARFRSALGTVGDAQAIIDRLIASVPSTASREQLLFGSDDLKHAISF